MADDITIYDRGKVERRIDPKLLEIIALDDLQVGINKLNKHWEKTEFNGILDPRVLSATDELQEIAPAYRWPFTPWISAYFINNGPDEVMIAINESEPFTLELNETITIDQTHANERIRVIHYICNPAETASVRVVGQF